MYSHNKSPTRGILFYLWRQAVCGSFELQTRRQYPFYLGWYIFIHKPSYPTHPLWSNDWSWARSHYLRISLQDDSHIPIGCLVALGGSFYTESLRVWSSCSSQYIRASFFICSNSSFGTLAISLQSWREYLVTCSNNSAWISLTVFQGYAIYIQESVVNQVHRVSFR